MKITNHRLEREWYQASADVGGALDRPQFIVLHYTAGGSGAASRDYMLLSPAMKQKAKGAPKPVYGSAHAVVDRDGTLWQIVPFNRMARHAGESRWRGLNSLNQYSIGIEMANAGWLDKQGDGRYKRPDTKAFKPSEVTIGRMPNATEVKGWENYPLAQLESVERLVLLLLDQYPSIREIVGHEEISPGRKFDPGPAFPLQKFKNLTDSRGAGALPGQQVAANAPEHLVTTCRTACHSGPAQDLPAAQASIEPGTRLVAQRWQGSWVSARLVEAPEMLVWIHESAVERNVGDLVSAAEG